MSRLFLTASVLALCIGTASADPIALILANEDYDLTDDVRRGDTPARAMSDLQDAGVRVVALADGTGEDMTNALSEFGQMVGGADAILVVLSGRFVSSATETFFLPTDTGPQPLATLPGSALPVSTVLAYLAEAPGRAILALATDDEDERFGPLLKVGIGDIELPQGVTLVTGLPREVARFASDGVTDPDSQIAAAARSAGLTATGYLA